MLHAALRHTQTELHMRENCKIHCELVVSSSVMVVFSISTMQASAFVYLIDSVVDLLPEISFAVSDSGMSVAQSTLSSSIFVSVELSASAFDDYCVTGDVTVTLQTRMLLAVLRTSNISDSLTLMYDSEEAPHRITILLSASESIERTFQIPVSTQTLSVGKSIDKRQFQLTAHMNSAHIKHVISHLVPFTDLITITLSDSNIKFAFAHTDIISKGSIVIGNSDTAPSQSVTSTYNASSFALFNKCIALHPVCNLYMSNNYPLMLETLVNELGKLTLHLVHVECPHL